MPKSKSSLKWAATGLSRLVLAFGVTIISQPAMASEPELARFEALYKAEWAWRQAEYPDFSDSKTQHLSDESLSSQKRRLTYWRGIAHELDRLDPTQLSEKDQINLRIFRAQIEVLINNQKFRTFEKPLNSDSAFWSDMRTLVQSPFRNEADYERYLGLLSEMPRYFDQELDNMKAGLARGFTPPRVTPFKAHSAKKTKPCLTSAATPISAPMAKAGRFIAKPWAMRWGCMKPPMNALACSAIKCGGRRVWWSIPASTPRAGRVSRRKPSSASYYLGELTILKARKKAEVALGAKFNLKAFHDTVLDIGSVPLPILEARIDKFIAEGGVGPYPDEEK